MKASRLIVFFLLLAVCLGCDKKSETPFPPPDAGIELLEGGWPGLRGLSLGTTPGGVVAIAEEKARILYLLELQHDGTWATTPVDRFIRWPHLHVDDSGRYHIVYWNGMRKAITYATNASGDWTTEDILTTTDCFVRPRISLDGSGSAHVAVFDYENSTAIHLTDESGQWETETVPISTDWYVDFACGNDDICYIAYYDFEADSHRVAVLEDGAWEVETVDDRERMALEDFPSIAVDETGCVHMMYANVDGFQYASKCDGNWEVEQLEWEFISDYSIKVDYAGTVHIVFLENEWGLLQHAVKVGEEWWLLPITYGYGDFASFGVDDSGDVHIAYKGIIGEATDLTGGLVYSHNIGGWAPHLLDRGSMAGDFVDMACKENGAVHVAHKDSLYENLRFASNASGVWDLRLLDDTDASGEHPSVCSGKKGRVHVAEITDEKGSQPKLRHIFGKDDSWTVEDVLSEGDYTTPDYTSIAVDAEGRVHIAFRQWSESSWTSFGSEIQHAVRGSNGSWTFETVWSVEGQMGDYLDMALDNNGVPHLAFFDYQSDDVKHAFKNGASWEVECAADNVGDQTRGVSIAVDDEGGVHISFLHGDEVGLGYATNRSSSWETRILDQFLEVNNTGDTSIDVDRNGHVHISYVAVEEFNPMLRYITDESGEWSAYDIDNAGRVGAYNSLAVDDKYDFVHIAYTAEDSLWHAVFPIGNPNLEAFWTIDSVFLTPRLQK